MGPWESTRPISVRIDGQRVETTVGRVLLYEIVPPEIPFSEVNRVMKKKELGGLVDLAYRLSREQGHGHLRGQTERSRLRLRYQGGDLDRNW